MSFPNLSKEKERDKEKETFYFHFVFGWKGTSWISRVGVREKEEEEREIVRNNLYVCAGYIFFHTPSLIYIVKIQR